VIPHTFTVTNLPETHPGDIGFDPLNLYAFRSSFGLYIVGKEQTKEERIAEAKKDMELCEVKNGRLAMIGITGMAFQELVSGIPV
jgi:Chlorophyll A-B binding protein